MNLQSKFGYCTITKTLNIAPCLKAGGITHRQANGRTDRQTDKRTDDPITRCPADFLGRGIKTWRRFNRITQTTHNLIILVCRG